MPAVFFDEEHARAATEELRRNGFEAGCRREPFAGEDDDEDHPWLVRSDAPEALLELLVERYDGWLEPEATPRPVTPLVLPDAPRRIERAP
jgi:hypothetical protein